MASSRQLSPTLVHEFTLQGGAPCGAGRCATSRATPGPAAARGHKEPQRHVGHWVVHWPRVPWRLLLVVVVLLLRWLLVLLLRWLLVVVLRCLLLLLLVRAHGCRVRAGGCCCCRLGGA